MDDREGHGAVLARAGMRCRALHNLATLSNTYGAANCSLLKLYAKHAGDGVGEGAAALPPAAFQACRHACIPKGGAGAHGRSCYGQADVTVWHVVKLRAPGPTDNPWN